MTTNGNFSMFPVPSTVNHSYMCICNYIPLPCKPHVLVFCLVGYNEPWMPHRNIKDSQSRISNYNVRCISLIISRRSVSSGFSLFVKVPVKRFPEHNGSGVVLDCIDS